MLPQETLQQLISTHGYWTVALIVGLESMGIPLPGETVLVLAAIYAAGDPTLKERTWVLLTEAAPGGWGLWGHAHTNEELVTAARAEIAKLKG